MPDMLLYEMDAPADGKDWEIHGPWNERLTIRLHNDAHSARSPDIHIEREGVGHFLIYVGDVLVYSYKTEHDAPAI
jgi:hypothetical protein